MNILGPTHVLDLIIPKIEEILSIANVNYTTINLSKTGEGDKKNKFGENIHDINNGK